MVLFVVPIVCFMHPVEGDDANSCLFDTQNIDKAFDLHFNSLQSEVIDKKFVALSSKFDNGDIVEVYNTGTSGLYVLDEPCGVVIGGKFDGVVGMVLDGPVYCVGYNRYSIRWSDDYLEGWSAEDWLRKKAFVPSTKFNIGDHVEVCNTLDEGLYVRTDPPELAVEGGVHDGDQGVIIDGPFYGVPKGKAGLYHFWKVEYGIITGWCAEGYPGGVDYLKPVAVHDMAVTNVYPVPSSPYVGQSTTIYVTAKNEGSQQENDVPVKAYVDGVQVGTTQYVTLPADESETKSFSWIPSIAKTYSVKGEVGVVSGEIETSDNTKTIHVVVSTQPQYNPKLTIPVYSPFYQKAHNGTSLTYIIKVTNEGNVEDTIELSVSKQSVSDNPEEWWDVQFLSSSIILASGESKDIFLRVVIPKNQPALNAITIRGESTRDKNCFDEISIKAEDTGLDSVLFGVSLSFKKSGGEHTLILEVPDFAEISDDQITPTAEVKIVFNPKNPGDLDNTYIKITDTVDGEVLSPPITLPIKFEQHSNAVITTAFDMQKDAYSFSNIDWEDDPKCYGMAATSILYFIDELLLPPHTTTYDLDIGDARTRATIEEYQKSWSYNKIIATWVELKGDNKMEEKEYNDELKENIGNGEPMLFFLGGKGLMKGHAVVAYRIVEDEDNKVSYILLYDPNWPYKKNYFLEAFPYITYDRNLRELSSYDNYNKFKLAKAEPWYKQIIIRSPASLGVYDSQGLVTGLVNEEVRNEIPYSMYEEENKTITIFFPSDSYQYDVVGTEEGTYSLRITSVENGEANNFTAIDIPTASAAVHQYTINWTALSQGEKGVTIQIDSDGDGTFEQTIITNNTFHPPVASFYYLPQNPIINQMVTFNASASYDPDGNITNYKWNFGDGNITNTTDQIITHTYVSTSNYTVNLTVTDDDGATNTDTTTLAVTEPPIADANGPYIGVIEYIAVPITFDGTGSYDPDGTITSYDWDLDNDGEFDDAVGATPTVSFTAPYSGNINLKVTDNNGATDTDTTTLTITKHSPPPNAIHGGLLTPPEQPQYYCGTSTIQGKGYFTIDERIQDWATAIDSTEHIEGTGEFEMASKKVLDQAANTSNPYDPNFYHKKTMQFQGNATNRLINREKFESSGIFGGTGTRINEYFDVSMIQKDESSSIKTISAPGSVQSHRFATMDDFSGIWGIHSDWQKICQKKIAHHQMFIGNFSVQKDLTFEREVVMP